MDEQETITGIIRKIRAEADSIEASARGSLKAGETWDGIAYTESDLEQALDLAETKRKEADRLEAAHKRERGDAAKSLKTVDLRFDICRDIALVLKIGRDYQNKDGYRGAHYDTVKLLCDTIEHQQEQLKAKTEVGDCAKLREAVVRVRDFADRIVEDRGLALAIINTCDAALAALPRNCDLYKTKEKAQEAFLKEPCDHPCGNCWVKDINNECGVDWLLATATEQKGGNNAD